MTILNTLSWMPRKPIPESEKKVGLAARIRPSLLRQLDDLARADDRTISYMVEKAITEFVQARVNQSRPRHK